MVFYKSVPGYVQGMGSWDHKGGASWEKYEPDMYAGKRKQKYKKDDKERCWHTSWLDYSKSNFMSF